MTNPTEHKLKYIKGLDTLRAFAVIIVIISHWGPNNFSSSNFTFIYQKIMPNGLFGVDVFFVLSGYLITRILLSARIESNDQNKINIVKAFYVRRSLRIFPIYYLLIFVVYLLKDIDVQNQLGYYLTYTSNFLVLKTQNWNSITHTWSLAVEEQFYLLWPWLIIFTPKRYLQQTIIASIFIGILSSLIFYEVYGKIFYVLTSTCLTAFSIGALLSFITLFPNDKIDRCIKLSLPLSLVFFVISQFGESFTLIRLINSFIAVNLIRYIVKEKYNSVTGFIFNNRILVAIGKISYGIYLYHFITPSYYLQFIYYLNQQYNFSESTLKILTYPPPAYLIQLSILFIISFLSYRFIESNFIRLKNYFHYLQFKPTKG